MLLLSIHDTCDVPLYMLSDILKLCHVCKELQQIFIKSKQRWRKANASQEAANQHAAATEVQSVLHKRNSGTQKRHLSLHALMCCSTLGSAAHAFYSAVVSSGHGGTLHHMYQRSLTEQTFASFACR